MYLYETGMCLKSRHMQVCLDMCVCTHARIWALTNFLNNGPIFTKLGMNISNNNMADTRNCEVEVTLPPLRVMK